MLPLQMSDDDGAYKNIKSYKDLARQNLRNVVMTSPGEKPMDGDFGVGIGRYLFENADAQTVAANVTARVYKQVGKYLEYINIYSVEVNQLADHAIGIVIRYYITPLGVSDVLELKYNHDNVWRS